MHIISRKALLDFGANHADANEPLDNWYRRAKSARWSSLNDVRNDYNSADQAGDCAVFNIKRNKYRLIVKIRYDKQLIFIRSVLTHAEYDKGEYRDDCNC